MTIPEPPKIPPLDIIDLIVAANMGAAARRAGFGTHANIYWDDKTRDGRLKSWAWELGWREHQWLSARQTEKRVEELQQQR
jgi:hypothetical protein